MTGVRPAGQGSERSSGLSARISQEYQCGILYTELFVWSINGYPIEGVYLDVRLQTAARKGMSHGMEPWKLGWDGGWMEL